MVLIAAHRDGVRRHLYSESVRTRISPRRRTTCDNSPSSRPITRTVTPASTPTTVPKEIPSGTVPLLKHPPEEQAQWDRVYLAGAGPEASGRGGLLTQINDQVVVVVREEPTSGADAVAGSALPAESSSDAGRSAGPHLLRRHRGSWLGCRLACAAATPRSRPGQSRCVSLRRGDTDLIASAMGSARRCSWGRNRHRPGPVAARRALQRSRRGGWEGRKAVHWSGRPVRRLFPQRRELRALRRLGPGAHAADFTRCVY